MEIKHRLQNFLRYQWQARTKYYIHSPFVYQFYLNVLEGSESGIVKSIKAERRKFSLSSEIVQQEKFNRGRRIRTMAELEKQVAVRHKYGMVLHRLIKYFQLKNGIETGTSIGISSAYMASASIDFNLITFEGNQSLLSKAVELHKRLELQNVYYLEGDIHITLPACLADKGKIDFAFIDADHSYDSTLLYFQWLLPHLHTGSVVIFDDIYWSKGMTKAWLEIKKDPSVKLTIDLYQFGICFFRTENKEKEDFVLRY